MRINTGFGAALVVALVLLGGGARAAGPTSPALLSSDPVAGAKLDAAPAEVTLSFSQPIDEHYSRIEVYDSCGKRVDVGRSTVSINDMSTQIERKPSGRYTVYYFANATPKGATGETDGIYRFTVKKGRPCR